MDKEAKKYQDIGFTIRTIYDAIGKGIADREDLERVFINCRFCKITLVAYIKKNTSTFLCDNNQSTE